MDVDGGLEFTNSKNPYMGLRTSSCVIILNIDITQSACGFLRVIVYSRPSSPGCCRIWTQNTLLWIAIMRLRIAIFDSIAPAFHTRLVRIRCDLVTSFIFEAASFHRDARKLHCRQEDRQGPVQRSVPRCVQDRWQGRRAQESSGLDLNSSASINTYISSSRCYVTVVYICRFSP